MIGLKHVFEKGDFVFVVLQESESNAIRLILFGKVTDHYGSGNSYGYFLDDIRVLWRKGSQEAVESMHRRWVEREPIEKQAEVKPHIPTELRTEWSHFRRKLGAKPEQFTFR